MVQNCQNITNPRGSSHEEQLVAKRLTLLSIHAPVGFFAFSLSPMPQFPNSHAGSRLWYRCNSRAIPKQQMQQANKYTNQEPDKFIAFQQNSCTIFTCRSFFVAKALPSQLWKHSGAARVTFHPDQTRMWTQYKVGFPFTSAFASLPVHQLHQCCLLNQTTFIFCI